MGACPCRPSTYCTCLILECTQGRWSLDLRESIHTHMRCHYFIMSRPMPSKYVPAFFMHSERMPVLNPRGRSRVMRSGPGSALVGWVWPSTLRTRRAKTSLSSFCSIGVLSVNTCAIVALTAGERGGTSFSSTRKVPFLRYVTVSPNRPCQAREETQEDCT